MDLATKTMTPLTSHINWDSVDSDSLKTGSISHDDKRERFSKLRINGHRGTKEIKLPKLPSGSDRRV